MGHSPLQYRTRTDICGKYQNFYVFKNTEPCHVAPAAGYANCETGTWSKEDQQGTVKRINYFRNLSGLSELKLSKNQKILEQEMKAALLCSQTDTLQHGGWTKKEKCYSKFLKFLRFSLKLKFLNLKFLFSSF